MSAPFCPPAPSDDVRHEGRLALTFDPELYEHLDQAKRDERDPVEKARFLSKRSSPPPSKSRKDPEIASFARLAGSERQHEKFDAH